MMKTTRVHINSIGAALMSMTLASILALMGQECFAGMVLTGGMGLAISFAEKKIE